MGFGLFLMVVGGILAFAVDDEVPNLDLGITGLIIMAAGAATIAYARNNVHRERVVTRRGDSEPHIVEEVVRERDSGPSSY